MNRGEKAEHQNYEHGIRKMANFFKAFSKQGFQSRIFISNDKHH